MTEIPRHADEEARRFYAAEPFVESLAAARVGIEHIQHHGQPLRYIGSSYPGDAVEHRFRCPGDGGTCPVVLAWRVTS